MASIKNEKMQDSDDSEEEVEEVYVLAAKEDVDDNDDQTIYFAKMLGIETEAPVMQINNKYYQGKWDKCMGTNIFFEEDKNAVVEDPIFSQMPERILKPVCTSRKVLRLNRIILKRNDHQAEEEELEEHAGSVEEALAKLRAYAETTESVSGQQYDAENVSENVILQGALVTAKKNRVSMRRISKEYDDADVDSG